MQDSHLLPKALYRFVRAKTKGSTSPIVVTRDAAWNTDRQITRHLLCFDCEQRFSKNGEDWSLRQIFRGEKSFKLLDILKACTPVATKPDCTIYAVADVAELRVQDLLYFAVSVFWRGAATDWSIDAHVLERLQFGPLYMTAFREYLLGRAGFPTNVALHVEVCDDPTLAATTLITPAGANAAGFHRYGFMIPGVAFHLFVGQMIPFEMRYCCIATGENRLLLRRNYEQFVKSKFAHFMKTSKPSARLKAME
ncbi:MAG TPA: hypothetical protein VGK29_22815 [Paludibaculum sp.]